MLIRTLVLTLVALSGAPALAGRCAYRPDFRRIECCAPGEQAIFHEALRSLQCVASTSGESCAWNPQLRRVSCCAEDQQAVWNPQLNHLYCCDPNGASNACDF